MREQFGKLGDGLGHVEAAQGSHERMGSIKLHHIRNGTRTCIIS